MNNYEPKDLASHIGGMKSCLKIHEGHSYLFVTRCAKIASETYC